MTEHRQRTLLRAAGRIHDKLVRLSRSPDVRIPEACWDVCCGLLRRINKADLRGWQAAGQRLRLRLEAALRNLESQVQETACGLSPVLWQRGVPPLQQLYEELCALDDEFGDVEYDFRNEVLTVVTEPIVLEELDLGRFEIRLEWTELGSPSPYTVWAQEPFRAASSESTTHPHVQDDRLCEGDGGRAIHSALIQGRLLDFFALVDRILSTYNSSSAYVDLANWSGEPCVDCDRIIDEDDRYRCERCDETLCSDCTVNCQRCEDCLCGQCIDRCAGCEELCCNRCLDTCPDCTRTFCRECLYEDERCENCHEASQVQEPDRLESAPQTTCKPKRRKRQREQQKPALRLSPYAWAKLLFLRDFGLTEVGGFGITPADDLLFVEDVQPVRQFCTSVTVQFDDAAVADFFDEQIDQGLRPEQFGRIWIHTHPGDSAEPSGVDEETFSRVFDGCDWAVMAILACGGQMYARLRFNVGPSSSLLIPVEVDFSEPFPAADPTAWEQEYETYVGIDASEFRCDYEALPSDFSSDHPDPNEFIDQSEFALLEETFP